MKSKTRQLFLIFIIAFVCFVEVANAFYDPGLQRWINRDPIQEDGGVNLHIFINNKVGSYVDPDGLQCFIGGIPPVLISQPPIVPPRLMLPPPRPYIPPYGLRPNPFRPGSWGRLGPDGRYQEIWRLDRGQAGAPGWRGIDHLHFNGARPHISIDTPYSFGPGGNIIPGGGTINAPPASITLPPGTIVPEGLIPPQQPQQPAPIRLVPSRCQPELA